MSIHFGESASLAIEMYVGISLEETIAGDGIDRVPFVTRELEYRMHGKARLGGDHSYDSVFVPEQTRHVDQACPVGVGGRDLRSVERNQRHPNIVERSSRHAVDDARMHGWRQNNRLGFAPGDQEYAKPGQRTSQAQVSWME